MALIDLPDPAALPANARDLYEEHRYGNESPYRRVRLHNPAVLRAQRAYQEALFEAAPVDEELFEYVMVAVAQANDCDYCAGSHRLKLMSVAGIDEAVIDAMAERDYSSLDERECAVVEFAEQAAADPHRIGPAHIEALQAVGFDEGDIVQLLAVIGACDTANTTVSALSITPADRDDDLPTY